MKQLLSRFLSDESGAAALEYALIAGLIALGIIAGATALGSALSTKFNDLGTAVTSW
jgi:pilus assembly protein Flp/PilA